MKEKNNSKNWGIGSVSLILSILATMFSFTFFNGKYFGEHILKLMGISLPINEISLVMLVIALFIGYKYKAVSYTHSEPTRLLSISYAVFCLKKKK